MAGQAGFDLTQLDPLTAPLHLMISPTQVRGQRIELGEIEASLAGHPLIRAVVVTTWEPVPGDLGLAAYYVADDDTDLDPGDLRAFLQG